MQAVQDLSTYQAERGKPMPSTNHAAVQTFLIGAMLPYADRYSVLSELSLELDGRPFVPDLCVYPRLDLDLRHDEVKKTEPPLLVIEILSPTQALDDLTAKTEDYFAAGVKSCWIVQPALHAIAVLHPDAIPEIYTSGDVTDPATGIEVNVDEIFRPFHRAGKGTISP